MTCACSVIALSSRDCDAVQFELDGVLTRTASAHAAACKRLFDGLLEQRSAGEAAGYKGAMFPWQSGSDGHDGAAAPISLCVDGKLCQFLPGTTCVFQLNNSATDGGIVEKDSPGAGRRRHEFAGRRAETPRWYRKSPCVVPRRSR